MITEKIIGILFIVGLYSIGSLSLVSISENRDRTKSNISLPEPAFIIKWLMVGFIFILCIETLTMRFYQ